MIERVLSQRIREYAPANEIEQENVLQELLQHYVLAGLAGARFFSRAVFHGGTCLKIVHNTNRFSEDLEFFLKHPDPSFTWEPHAREVCRYCAMEGIDLDIVDKSRLDSAVKKTFLKTDSIGKMLHLELPHGRHSTRKIRIKLEIDTNPPQGSALVTGYLTFPVIAAITTQALESGFATKAHALLCREYVKGRDWYDFVWYVSRRVVPDLVVLRNALPQQGAWAGADVDVTAEWLLEQLRHRITVLDWGRAVEDVSRFLPLREQTGLQHWGVQFFLYQLDRMADYIR